MSEAKALMERIAGESVRAVDFRFTDLAGRWRQTSLDASGVNERLLSDGFLVDGSALPGWRDPNEPDLLLRPDLQTAQSDPFAAQPTLQLVCDVAEPASGLAYERDPRSVATRAEAAMRRHGLADRVLITVEIGLFLFDEIRLEQGPARLAVELAGAELRQPAGAGYTSLDPGRRPSVQAARLTVPPFDPTADIRAEIAGLLASLGFTGLGHDHGRAPQQARFTFAATGILAAGDRIQILKDVVRHVAASYGKTACFMAKPLADQPGSALAVEMRLFAGERAVFAGQGYADLSPACLCFIGGVLKHARALNALTNPATNSYRRLRAGMEEPVHLAFAAYNRSAAIRIPFAARPHEKAVEVRFPDPLANPYLALAGLLLAGLDGVMAKTEPGDAMDRNLYDLLPHERAEIATVAGSLDEALLALAADREFLTRHEVVPDGLLDAYIELKRAEAERVAQVPHPVEFDLYGSG